MSDKEWPKERPILFSGPMVRALLAGTKTQTRRLVKPQPERNDRGVLMWPVSKYRTLGFEGRDVHPDLHEYCPYGRPGDRLWVKEQTVKVEDAGWIGPVYTESDAGRQALEWGYGEPDDPDHIPPHAIKRRPSLFMTRAMSRITLEVASVRVERLQDISAADAEAEGTLEWAKTACAAGNPYELDATGYFELLWSAINGRASWDANPWVWVVEFKRVNP